MFNRPPAAPIAEWFCVRRRFFRSTHLERDFQDASALDGYVVNPQITEPLERIVAGLQPDSGQRAWRLTGDYGVGKSSFALLLAQVLSSGREAALNRLGGADSLRATTAAAPRLLPVLVTGSRRAVALALVDAITRALSKPPFQMLQESFAGRLQTLAAATQEGSSTDEEVVKLVGNLACAVKTSGLAEGLLIILDEMGKFLEYAAQRPERQDVYFLQLLAESCTRSAGAPTTVIGLLHQGFHAYADKLSDAGQREWEKVAGRYEQITFDRPLSQTAVLVGNALNLDLLNLPTSLRQEAEGAMGEAVALGWYGPGSRGRERELLDTAPQIYPLHASVLPLLARFLSRFGQHERSLFQFLLSHEPFALQAFARQPAAPGRYYRLHHLYDYARANFGHQLSLQSYRSHWNQVESLVEAYVAQNPVELWLLKTVAMLNLIDDQGLLAAEPAIRLAVEGEGATAEQVQTALACLCKRGVLHYRGNSGGYCLWPHTSINLERAYQEATRAVGVLTRVAPEIAGELDARPLVARRHYIETGNLRHFAVRCVGADDLGPALERAGAAIGAVDGTILLPLCETGEDRERSLAFARSPALRERADVLCAVPMPLETLKGAVQELQRWRWVASLPELTHDTYAADVVSRQVNACLRLLRERIAGLVGLRRTDARTELEWYWRGEALGVVSGRDLLGLLSKVCNTLYPEAPRVHNELINRRELSSAAAAARMRLIERVLTTPSLPDLGLDATKKPPERSMYLSVLAAGRMHVARDDAFVLQTPSGLEDPLSLAPVFERILREIDREPNTRVRVSEIFAVLRRPPYGVRDGLLPLLLAVLAACRESELAFYEDGRFLRRMGGAEFMRLVKDPESFEVQQCRVAGVRASLFAELSDALKLARPPDSVGAGVLHLVQPLCIFAAQLPPYVLRTRQLSAPAARIRAVLTAAHDPAKLLFEELPTACGYPPFTMDAAADEQVVQGFVTTLRDGLEELRLIYGRLLERVRSEVLSAFARPGFFEEVRHAVAQTAGGLVDGTHEPRLRGFCQRLGDLRLDEPQWLESVGSYVSGKPPAQWADSDSGGFCGELHRLAQQFRRLEAAAFRGDSPAGSGGSAAMRVAITLADGSDTARVMHVAKEDEALVTELEGQIRTVIALSRRAGLAAASRAILKEFQAGEAGATSC